MVLNVNDMKYWPRFCLLFVSRTVKKKKKNGAIFTAEVVSASVFARSGCHGKDSEMFGSGGCFCGLSEMRVGFSFYVMGSGVLWVRPQWNC